jgi:exodeoxyribonuclease VII large subunit
MDSLLLFPSEEARIFTVSRLNAEIKGLVEAAFPFVWVVGEISNLRTPASGHHYFTLKDEQSQIRAVMFRTQQRALRFRPESGLQVLCQGHISVYEPRGEYQIIVESMEPKGAGAMQIAFEQLKRKLEAEGLCDPARKRPLPVCPQRIAVVTSATGAAVRDILKVFQRSPCPLSVTVFPVRVQGQEAAAEIACAIQQANALADKLDLDVIIVGRGGGSIEDLWSFNEEIVARAIAASEIPTISAVGHEIDFTISDAVSDMRAPTPTAAAEWVISRLDYFSREVSGYKDRIRQAICTKVSSCIQQTSFLGKRLISPQRQIENLRLLIDDRSDRLNHALRRTVEKSRSAQCLLSEKLLYLSPLKTVRQHQALVDQREKELLFHYHNTLDKYRLRLQKYASQLESLSPLSVLGRGYAIAYRLPDEKVLRKAEDVSVGDKVRVQLSEGFLECVVQGTKNGNSNSLQRRIDSEQEEK